MTDLQTDVDLNEFLGVTPASPRRKWLLRGALGVLLLIALLLLTRCFSAAGPAGYLTTEARRGDLSVSVTATGNLQPINQVDVGSEQSGLITEVYVDFNDEVKKGQVLATLDTSRLLDTVQQAKAALEVAQAGVSVAQATLAQSSAELARMEEVHQLSAGKVPSPLELDTARATEKRSAASLQSAQAQVAQARAQVATAETNLAKARIYSPVDGVVLSRSVDPGQTVAASLQAPVLFVLAEDLTKMKLEIAVDEADVGQVTAGQHAVFSVDAFPEEQFPASITRVNLGANTDSASSSASGGNTVVAYTAVLAVDNPDKRLRPGMTATAEIVTEEITDALLVPNAALRFTPQNGAVRSGRSGITGVLIPSRPRGSASGQELSIGRGSRQHVYVLDAAGEPVAVAVSVGSTDGSWTAVTSDELQAGTPVVTGRMASAAKVGP